MKARLANTPAAYARSAVAVLTAYTLTSGLGWFGLPTEKAVVDIDEVTVQTDFDLVTPLGLDLVGPPGVGVYLDCHDAPIAKGDRDRAGIVYLIGLGHGCRRR